MSYVLQAALQTPTLGENSHLKRLLEKQNIFCKTKKKKRRIH